MKAGWRTGYTTGTCAAAAAKAAVSLLYGGEADRVSVRLPTDEDAELEIAKAECDGQSATCSVIKFAGDDPDVTDGLSICATAMKSDSISLDGGEGVGRVTLRGLAVSVGEAAINPTPRRMILAEVEKVLPPGCGAKVVIHVPDGEAVAEKTFNARLGIVGGISIIGTTGVVRPMSLEAHKASLALQVDVATARGARFLVLVPGNHGERAAAALGFEQEIVLQMSNYVGFMLERCTEAGVEEVLLLGHVGKMIKVAEGRFNTHSSVAPLRLELLAEIARGCGESDDLAAQVASCNTAEEAITLLGGSGEIFDRLAKAVAKRATAYLNDTITVSVGVTDLSGTLVGASENARRILAKL